MLWRNLAGGCLLRRHRNGRLSFHGMERAQINNIAREEQIQRPVDRNTQLALKARQLDQVNRAPEPSGDEAGKSEPKNLGDGAAAAQAGQEAERLELKCVCCLTTNRRRNVVRQSVALTQ